MRDLHYDNILVDSPVWFSSTRSIDCKSKKDENFSLVQIVVGNDPNLDASPPTQTSSMVTVMETRESHISLIWAV